MAERVPDARDEGGRPGDGRRLPQKTLRLQTFKGPKGYLVDTEGPKKEVKQ